MCASLSELQAAAFLLPLESCMPAKLLMANSIRLSGWGSWAWTATWCGLKLPLPLLLTAFAVHFWAGQIYAWNALGCVSGISASIRAERRKRKRKGGGWSRHGIAAGELVGQEANGLCGVRASKAAATWLFFKAYFHGMLPLIHFHPPALF